MLSRSTISILAGLLLASTVLSLQVAPGSPCSSLCLDVPGSDITNPEGSNTFTTDIVCRDTDYTGTDIGKKFKGCLSCLQGSSWSGFKEDDQSWFIYNLRFAAGSCLYDHSNMTATSIGSSCSSDSTCGPLQPSIEEGSLSPTSNTFSYCSVDGNSFIGSNLQKCTTCLLGTDETKFLGNFLIALQAGCLQRPSSRLLIGLQGDPFSETPLKVTFGGDVANISTTSQPEKKQGLSREAIVGIAAGVGVPILAIVVILCYCLHKRSKTSRMTRLRSPLDSRFGSKTITSPNNGAYGNPYASPQINVKDSLTTKELEYLESATPLPSGGSYPGTFPRTRGDHTIRLDTSAVMPIHQAYLPGVTSPVSPATSVSTRRNSQIVDFSHPKQSPPMTLPTIDSPQTPSQSHEPRIEPSTTSQSARPNPAKQTENSQVYPSRLYSETRNQQDDVSQSSRVYPSAMHSQKAHFDNSQTRARSRSRSREPTGNISHSNSVTNTWRRATFLQGVGNANASQEKPLQNVGGSSAVYGTRLDFEIAERERLEKERKEGGALIELEKRKRTNVTPSSAGSEEQWPGNY